MQKETFTGPRDSWKIVWEVVQEVINSTDDEYERQQIQVALNSIYEGSN